MTELLRIVLVMSLSGGVLALLLFALKPLVRNRLPKSAQYRLWLVVLAMLLVPLSVVVVIPDESPLTLASVSTMVEQITVPFEETAWRPESDTLPDPGASTIAEPNANTNPNLGSPARSEPPALPPGTIILLVYALGLMAVLLHTIVNYRAFTGMYRRRNLPAWAEEIALLGELCGSRRAPVLYRNPLVATPMLVGLLRPAILLPDRNYTDVQLRSVLLHELTHWRRLDVLVKWLSVLACAVHWFNPIVWFARREIDTTCELSCDEVVVRDWDAPSKRSYGNTLLAVASDGRTPRVVVSTTMCEQKKELKERLGAIMKYKKQTRILLVLSALALMMAILAACVLGAGSWSGKTSVMTSEMTSESPPSIPEATPPQTQTEKPPNKPLEADKLYWGMDADHIMDPLVSTMGAFACYFFYEGAAFGEHSEDPITRVQEREVLEAYIRDFIDDGEQLTLTHDPTFEGWLYIKGHVERWVAEGDGVTYELFINLNYCWVRCIPSSWVFPPEGYESIEEYVQAYLRIIDRGDAEELRVFLNNGVNYALTNESMDVVERVIEYYSLYDLGSAAVEKVGFGLGLDGQRFRAEVRDGRGETFWIDIQMNYTEGVSVNIPSYAFEARRRESR